MTELVQWCWDEHDWIDCTPFGSPVIQEYCTKCGDQRTRPFAEPCLCGDPGDCQHCR